MKTNQTTETEKTEIKALIDLIAPEKLDRALYILEYMVKESTTTEERKAMNEYFSNEDVTIDMLVDWVRDKQKAVAV